MDAIAQQVGERGVDRALAVDPALAREGLGDDLDREMAFAPFVVAGMAAMAFAVVADEQMRRGERVGETLRDFGGDRAGFKIGHALYIMGLDEKGSRLASAGKRQTRFHGRVEGHEQACAHPGCAEAGEFRAPPAGARASGFDGPGDWRWLCLDHVREFNLGYNFFSGMSPDEIADAQTPYGGWERATRAFSTNGSPGPRWSDFTDPLDAIGARFARREAEREDGRALSEGDRKHLRVLGLGVDIDRRALRLRYTELLRRYHPDHNGGDRGHEKALQAVIEAYTQLKSRPAFA